MEVPEWHVGEVIFLQSIIKLKGKDFEQRRALCDAKDLLET